VTEDNRPSAQEYADLYKDYAERHWALIEAKKRIKELESEVAWLKAEMKKMVVPEQLDMGLGV
jgi:plasmid stabilization system protein ParE